MLPPPWSLRSPPPWDIPSSVWCGHGALGLGILAKSTWRDHGQWGMLGGCSGMDQKLSKLVEELTTSGEPQLNPEKMKELKKICKSSEEQLSHAYHLLTAQLSQDHAEIRLSAFQAIDELFARSHQFRMLVVSNFQEFLELTLGTDHEQPLPPPREVAQRLRQAATRAVQGWHEKYGAAYKKLALGYHFLRHSKQVDFQDVSARTVAERKREEEKQKRLDRIYRERSERAIREMEEMSEEIRRCLTEVESCFRLLVPLDFATGLGASLPWAGLSVSEQSALCQASVMNRGDEEQPCCSKTLLACTRHPGAGGGEGPPPAATGAEEQEEEEDSDSDEEGFVRRHGLGSHKYTLDVELSSDSLRVREDEDNHAVIHSARDALKLIQYKFLPAVCSWVQLFTRAEIHGGHLEAAIHLKAELETALRRSGELDIKPEDGHRREVAAPWDRDEDEDDGDFVEVPEKEGYEACIPDHLRPEYGWWLFGEKGCVLSGSTQHTHRRQIKTRPMAFVNKQAGGFLSESVRWNVNLGTEFRRRAARGWCCGPVGASRQSSTSRPDACRSCSPGSSPACPPPAR
ncbi:UV-stimulated scaffold protein A isoform X6 [Ursus americanus]|uniref:UV-stimulated scaffold protein A isoform X6 n=1 Tax=Ursus americanus TaxID=9643 RepID=UPI001E679966|nr:UV-stimulated scaffold protein A isoform X6 [Ursus americanus]